MDVSESSASTMPECGYERFARSDWLSLLGATTLSLAVYLFTLAPDVTLGFSGIFSTGAFYGGVPHPPGYPLFTIYAWFFTHLLPFSNVAWRVAVASAVAAALSCGMLSMLVSQMTGSIIRSGAQGTGATPRRKLIVQVVCGCSASLAFGFSNALWKRAVIADPWPFSICLFCLCLCLLRRWSMQPSRKCFLYWAAFAYGLTLTNSQMLLAAAPVLVALLVPGSKCIARDTLVVVTLTLAWIAYKFITAGFFSFYWFAAEDFWPVVLVAGIIALVATAALIWRTRAIFTEWRVVLSCAVAVIVGLTPYLYVPIASMTNPPINWGYARSAGGFVHTFTRGQYERIAPTRSFQRFRSQIKDYLQTTLRDFGWPQSGAAMIPFVFFRRIPRYERIWLANTAIAYLSFTLLLIAISNPDPHATGAIGVFYSASYAFLALWLGCCLGLLGARSLSNSVSPIPSR
jgi:hypothetical protein